LIRRIHIHKLEAGEHRLDESEAHHARDVLRLPDGAPIELFDDEGNCADGVILHQGSRGAAVRVEKVRAQSAPQFQLTIASAVPKAERADWMIEKLSELGVTAFIPLITARSVVHPQGHGKRQRWERIATESAKQCRRAGVMRIEPLTDLADAIKNMTGGWYLSTGEARPISQMQQSVSDTLSVFVGPEGGWTEQEIEAFESQGLSAVALTSTILRIETAAISVAAILGTQFNQNHETPK
jgi:16S rRNA (uracil1498-N3)-methyltransferase